MKKDLLKRFLAVTMVSAMAVGEKTTAAAVMS